MWLTEVVPRSGDRIESDADGAREWLAQRYAPPADARFTRINMVTSLTGSATGGDGTSDSITSPLDRMILGLIRSLADVVVVGAATVRSEGYVVPSRARLAVVSGSGNLEGNSFDPDRADQVIVLTPGGRSPSRSARRDRAPPARGRPPSADHRRSARARRARAGRLRGWPGARVSVRGRRLCG